MPVTAHLDRIFRPRSVALVGLSGNPRKLNGVPLAILQTTGFPGAIYPVNPAHETIGGVRAYPTIASLPETPDVALVMVPASEVPEVLEACGRKGTHGAVVISSGFEEAGGDALVDAVRAACRRHEIALVGPNCEGVWSVRSRALLTFGSAAKREHLAHRPIAILSQSGAMGGSVARHLQDSGFGCAYVVSVGNETVLGLLDYLEYMIEQDDVRVVVMFMEGLKQGARLLELAERARRRGIVLVALKAGNSRVGREAAASHTGKVASAADVYHDICRQAGIVTVDGLHELIEAAEVLSTLPLPRSTGRPEGGLTVYSIPGGTRALTADVCEQRGVPLAVFHPDTVAALKAKLPEFGYAQNPTDITGKILSAPQLLGETLGIVAGDPHTEALLIQLANRGPADAAQHQETIRAVVAATGVPTVLCFLGDTLPGKDRLAFAGQGLACARDPGDAVRYFSWLYAARASAQRPLREELAVPPAATDAAATDWSSAMHCLARAGIAAPPWRFLRAGEEAGVACADLAWPVALKALPEDAEHKTERGLLHLGLRDAAAVGEAAHDLRRKLGRADATLLVQEMVPAGVETVLSVRRDPDFGAVLSLGSGGVLIELVRDLGHVCLPPDRYDIEALIDRLRLARLLAGFRGAPAADREALVAAALGLARVFGTLPLAEFEINPLIVLPRGRGVMAVDVLLKPQAG